MKIKSKLLSKQNYIDHRFFGKTNGYSKGIYKSLNCGIGSNDNYRTVLRNISYVEKTLNIKKNNLVLMKQTHSNKIKLILDKPKSKTIADGMITKNKTLALGVLTADCIPILFFEKQNKLIGCVHAGWRGAVNGIIENFIKKIKIITKNNFQLFAAVGPCISQNNYEVGDEFYKNLTQKNPKNKLFFKMKNHRWFFNLRKYVNIKLSKYKNIKIENINLDTFSNKNIFFSCRRSKKDGENDYGRCISVIKFK